MKSKNKINRVYHEECPKVKPVSNIPSVASMSKAHQTISTCFPCVERVTDPCRVERQGRVAMRAFQNVASMFDGADQGPHFHESRFTSFRDQFLSLRNHWRSRFQGSSYFW